ncbi:MAG: hypothetical protein MZV65_27325 [Chromatiales bacterium]|nr:hypothetical protein [Chromatiales bacterium]
MRALSDKVRAAARALSAARQSAHGALENQRTELARLKARRHELRTAPLSRADLESALIEDVTREQQRVLSGGALPAALWEMQRRPQATAAIVDGGTERANYWPLNTGHFDANTAGLLTLLLGEPLALVARLSPILDQMSFENAGPSLADRRAELASLESSIAALETEIGETEAEMRSLGVMSADHSPNSLSAPRPSSAARTPTGAIALRDGGKPRRRALPEFGELHRMGVECKNTRPRRGRRVA